MGAIANITPAPGVVPIAGPSGKLDPSWVPEATSGTSGIMSTGTQTLAGDKTFVGNATLGGSVAQTNASGIRTQQATTQDAVALVGRAGGTSSRANTITTAALGANRTTTLPDGNLTFVTGGSLHLGGTAVLVAGTVTVANSAITANTRIFLTSQVDGGTVGFLRVSARVASTSFTITSSNVLDTSTVAWFYTEP